MNFGGKVLTDNRYRAYLVKGNGMHGIDRTISFKRQLSGDHFVQDDPKRDGAANIGIIRIDGGRRKKSPLLKLTFILPYGQKMANTSYVVQEFNLRGKKTLKIGQRMNFPNVKQGQSIGYSSGNGTGGLEMK